METRSSTSSPFVLSAFLLAACGGATAAPPSTASAPAAEAPVAAPASSPTCSEIGSWGYDGFALDARGLVVSRDENNDNAGMGFVERYRYDERGRVVGIVLEILEGMVEEVGTQPEVRVSTPKIRRATPSRPGIRALRARSPHALPASGGPTTSAACRFGASNTSTATTPPTSSPAPTTRRGGPRRGTTNASSTEATRPSRSRS